MSKTRILLAGGGSGGHVTPLLAVTNELNRQNNNLTISCICDRKFQKQAVKLLAKADIEVEVKAIWAGKWRRYHRLSWWRQLLDVKTVLLNLRDVCLTGFGALQALWLLIWRRPDVAFLKGGFVCVPVGLAAWLLRVPVVMHDSDAHPGLASRIVAKFAKSIATGSPLENYSYPSAISRYVGVPISNRFQPMSQEQKQAARSAWDLPDAKRPLLVVTGGGLGAQRVNQATAAIADEVVENLGMSIVHVTGQNNYDAVSQQANKSSHYRLLPFVHDSMPELLASADVVVSRAGATTLLELAAVRAAAIIVPNPYLTGGHQLKNARVYKEASAIEVVEETDLEDPQALLEAIKRLVEDSDYRRRMADNLADFAKPDAAKAVADMVLEAVKR